MRTRPHPTVLLIEDTAAPENVLRDVLQGASFRVITLDAQADPGPTVTKERPDLIVAAAGVSASVIDRLHSSAAEDWPNVLALTSPSSPAGNVDFLDPNANKDFLLARIHWHLRLRRVELERERLLTELQGLKRHASIGAVADSVTHNLNNVLGIIFGYMHLIKMHHEKPEMILKHHAALESAVAKITEMVRRFGEAARETQPEPEPAGVVDLLETAIERFRRESDVDADFPFVVEPPDLQVTTSFSRSKEALAGLLKNAWESYGDAPLSERDLEIRATADEEYVTIRIRDRGAGIDPEVEPTMFEPFSGTKDSDGLGLALARRCFRNLGGDLFLKNHPEGGAIAEVRHPL